MPLALLTVPAAGHPVCCLRPWKYVHGPRTPREHSLHDEALLTPHPWPSCPTFFLREGVPRVGRRPLVCAGDEAQAGKFSRPAHFQSRRPFCPIRCSWASAARAGTHSRHPTPCPSVLAQGGAPLPVRWLVKTSFSHAGGAGSIPGGGAKIPHASWLKCQDMKSEEML